MLCVSFLIILLLLNFSALEIFVNKSGIIFLSRLISFQIDFQLPIFLAFINNQKKLKIRILISISIVRFLLVFVTIDIFYVTSQGKANLNDFCSYTHTHTHTRVTIVIIYEKRELTHVINKRKRIKKKAFLYIFVSKINKKLYKYANEKCLQHTQELFLINSFIFSFYIEEKKRKNKRKQILIN